MDSLKAPLRCALCATFLLLAGCYSSPAYSPYSPYGPPGYPGYTTPPMTVPGGYPQGGYPAYPQGGFPSGGFPSNGFAPSGAVPTEITPVPDSNFSGSGANSFDPAATNNIASDPQWRGNNNGLVPDPQPLGSNLGQPQPLGSSDILSQPGTRVPPGVNYDNPPGVRGGEFVPPPRDVPPSSGSGNTFEGNTTPFTQDGATFTAPMTRSESVSRAMPPKRLIPVNATPVTLAAGETANRAVASSAAPRPFDKDPQGYRWLRGKLDYDAQDRTWLLFYSLTPDPQDPFHGRIALVDNGQLAGLSDQAVVYVEGEIDQSVTDPRTGKPCYRINRLQELAAR